MSTSKKITNSYGSFYNNTPGNVGKVVMKCEIFGNNPIYKRPYQDQQFVLSDQTISRLPGSVQSKLAFTSGTDGVYLRPVYNYRNTYICTYKEIESENENTENFEKFLRNTRTILNGNVIDLQDLTFVNPENEALQDKLVFDTDNPNLVTSASAEASHQIFIASGSIFSNQTVSPEKYSTDTSPNAKWRYNFINTSPKSEVNSSTSNENEDKNISEVSAPSQIQSSFSNEGIHWSVLKRTPLFQGEDFWLEFQRTATEFDVPRFDDDFVSPNLLDEYRFLDVNLQSDIGDGFPTNGAVVDRNKNGEIIEESKEIFDFYKQAYLIIEIGKGSIDDHYFIILCQNAFPIFVQSGRFVSINYKNIDDGNSNNDVGFPNIDISRQLSSWEIASSSALMRQDRLRVTVRNHFGDIIITFSGYEDEPWIISKKDIVLKNSGNNSLGVDSLEYRRTPMIVTRNPIAIHGGNIKTSFVFSPLQYETGVSFNTGQDLHLLGPIEKQDINLYLREKGINNNIEYNSSLPQFDFLQDAQAFSEIINGQEVVSKMIDVNPEKFLYLGKSPYSKKDQQTNSGAKLYLSTIKVSLGDLMDVGSSSDYVKKIRPTIGLFSGDAYFPTVDGNRFILSKCITPIMTHFRLNVPPDGASFNVSPIDVSHHVLNFSESWSASDFFSIEHTGNISFYVSDGLSFENNQASFLLSLLDKTFYIQISAWWEGGVMPKPDLERDRVIFTGLCHGGTLEQSNNKKIMTCQIFDYFKILKDQIFLNSPFFDKMRDFNAILEILRIASFREGINNNGVVTDTLQPASLLRRLADSQNSGWFELSHNGEIVRVNDYALPGSYDILQNSFMRFNDGEFLSDAIVKIATYSGKVAYFDRLGVFHFENLPDENIFFNTEDLDPDNESEDILSLSKMDFFASPRNAKSNSEEDLSNPNNDIDDDIISDCDIHIHRQIFNTYTIKRNVEDIVNEIKIISTTPNGELLLAGHTNFESLYNKESPGFLGYRKIFFQMDGIFGSEEAVKKMIKYYTTMFTPPVTVGFEAMGRNRLKALDIITVQFLGRSGKQPLRIMSINSEIDPSTNSWIQKFECEWLMPSQDVEFGNSDVYEI